MVRVEKQEKKEKGGGGGEEFRQKAKNILGVSFIYTI